MKKLSLLLALLIGAIMLPQSCSYDDKDLWQAVDDLDYRVGALEEAVKNLTDQTSALQKLIDNKLFIESVEVDDDGNYILHTITPDGKTSTIKVTNGKDGKDGESPAAPAIGVERDADGNYYWTIDGERLLDSDGNPVRVNGTDGANGTDGKTPTFKIEDGKWYVSFDNGINWTGPYGQATGADGDAFFSNVTVSPDGKHVVLTLIDGSEIVLELYKEFNIAFDGIENVLVMPGQSREITFRITNPTPATTVEAFGKDGWEASVVQEISSAGVIKVSAPADRTGAGRVVVFVSDGDQKTLMRTLSFVSGAVELSTSSVFIPLEGGTGDVDVTTSIDFTATVEEDAREWLSLIQGRAYEVHTEKISFSASANDTPYQRTGRILLSHDGKVVESILVIQDKVTYDKKWLVLRIDGTKMAKSGVKFGSFTLPARTGSIEVDWGDGSEHFTGVNTGSSQLGTGAASFNMNHVYSDEYYNKEFCIFISGNIDGWTMSSTSDVVDIIQWGDMPWRGINIRGINKMTHLTGREEGFPSLTSFTISYSTALRTIDRDFFAKATEITSFNSAFTGCTALEELPDDLFRNQLKVRNLQDMYSHCTSLVKPAKMYMKGDLSTPTIRGMFLDCTSLKTIPADLFTKEFLNSVTSFNSVFNGCTSLETVPEEFYANLGRTTKDAHPGMMFYGCSNLRDINFETFFNKGAGLHSISFGNIFNGCTKLTGKIPTIRLTVDGTDYDMYPWQRADYINHEDMKIRQAARDMFIVKETFYDPPLANTINNISGSGCFGGCIGLEGYYNTIPQSWGGGWDGTTEKPRLSLKSELTPGAEYHSINFTMKAQGAQEAYYWLGSLEALNSWLPKFNNDVTALCKARGTKFWPEDLAKLNSSDGYRAMYDECIPENDYVLVVSAKNMFGEVFQRLDIRTAKMPKGDAAFENFIGRWKVTSTGSTSMVKPDCGDVSFELTVVPYRVNNSYLVAGWGGSQFANQGAVRFIYEGGKVGIYSGNFDDELSMHSVIATNIPYDDGEGEILYNVAYAPYCEMPDGTFGWYFVPTHCMLQGAIDANTFKMEGQLAPEMSEYGLTKPCSGLEICLVMGGYGWEKRYLPGEFMLPENTITVDGKTYGKFSLAPYTLTKINSENPAPAMARAMQPKGKTLLFDSHRKRMASKAYKRTLPNHVMKIAPHRR